MTMKETRKYKQTELGLVPADWIEGKFEDFLSTFSTGATPYRGNSDFFKGDILWISSGELNYNWITSTKEHISVEALNKTNLKLYEPGTFLMAITGLEAEGTRGRCAFVGSPAATNQSCLAINSSEKMGTDYLFYFYIYWSKTFATKYSQGTKQQSYTALIVRNLPIYCPNNITEQRRIASALTSIDNLLDSLDRLIAKKRDIKQSAMQQLLSGKKRLKGFVDKWETLLFKDIFTFLTTNTFARELLNIKGEIKNIHYGDILTNYSEVLDVSKTDLPYIDSNKVTRYNPVILAQDGDIIIADTAEDEAVCKATEIYNIGNAKVVSGLHTMWCRPKNNIFAPKFLGYYINSSMFHDQILPLIQGIKVSSVSKNAIKNTWISFPTISEQQAIASVLTSMDNELSALEAKRKKYEQIKQGMMQQLLTGKIRLENASTVH